MNQNYMKGLSFGRLTCHVAHFSRVAITIRYNDESVLTHNPQFFTMIDDRGRFGDLFY
jgi:hypothetical protein